MIVKITYSSDLEEVPMEVSKLLKDLEKQTLQLAKSLPTKELSATEPDIKSSVSKLEHCLASVEKLEAKMKDCHAILNGFLGVKEKQKETDEPVETGSKKENQK